MLSFSCLADYVMWLLDQLLVQSCVHQRMALLLTVSAVRLNGPRNPTTCRLSELVPEVRVQRMLWNSLKLLLLLPALSLFIGERTTWVFERRSEASTHILFFFKSETKEMEMRKLNFNFKFCEKVNNLMFLFTFYLSYTYGFLGYFTSIAVEDVGNCEHMF